VKQINLIIINLSQKINNLRADWNQKYINDLEEKNSQLEHIQGKRSENLHRLKNLAEIVISQT